MQEQTEL